jgi:phosphoserine aminotransferase
MNSNTQPVYNFSAGPCVLPKQVLSKCAEEMMNYNGTGLSVMEISHRSKDFIDISERAKGDLRTFLKIPNNFKIFMF